MSILTLQQQSAIISVREKTGFAAVKIKSELQLPVGVNTIHRLLKKKGLLNEYGNHIRPRYQETTHMHLKNTTTIGKLQMDVKYITPELSGLPYTCFEYAIIDIYSRYKEAVILNHLDQDGAILALMEILQRLPFTPDFIQTDNGLEFLGRFPIHFVYSEDYNTSEFAVASLRRWWQLEGKHLYLRVKHLMLTADSGSSNSNRSNQFLWELQQLANETQLTIHVCHFPAGTSKWNKIEHKLFSYISRNWQGVPLVSYEIILGLIGATTTKTGLEVKAVLDRGKYALHKKPTKEQIRCVRIRRHKFHPEWNYSIYSDREIV